MNYIIKQWMGYKITSEDIRLELEKHLKYSKLSPQPLIDKWNELLAKEKTNEK